MVRRFRSGVVPLALLGAVSVGAATAVTSPLAAEAQAATVSAAVQLLDSPQYPGVEYAEVMAGSGTPIPQLGRDGDYMDLIFSNYLQHSFPNLTSPLDMCPSLTCDVNGLVTPEGLYPLTGIKDLPLDTSVDRGVWILDNQIHTDLGNLTGNQELGVFGYSQSAVISSLEMSQLHASDPDAPVNFVLIGNPMAPNGGLLSRFGPSTLDGIHPQLNLPSLGLQFYGGTPDDYFPTTMYTMEYDGFADFPRYPINILADLNAFAGIQYVHGTYPDLDPNNLPTGYDLVQLPVDGSPMTDYYMIDIPNLPLLEPVRSIPLVGNPVSDLLQPVLTPLINMGYGDPDFGWSTDAANVTTPFGILPPLSAFEKLPGALFDGTQQGIEDFIGDFTGSGPNPVSLSLDSLLPSLGAGSGAMAGLDLTDPLGSINAVVNAFTSAAATGYATLLPTADIVNALLTSIPMYNVDLLVQNLLAGDVLDAIGLPIAADVGLVTMAGGFEFLVAFDAAQSILADFTSLIPF